MDSKAAGSEDEISAMKGPDNGRVVSGRTYRMMQGLGVGLGPQHSLLLRGQFENQSSLRFFG